MQFQALLPTDFNRRNGERGVCWPQLADQIIPKALYGAQDAETARLSLASDRRIGSGGQLPDDYEDQCQEAVEDGSAACPREHGVVGLGTRAEDVDDAENHVANREKNGENLCWEKG